MTARRVRRKRQGVFIMVNVTTVGCWKLKVVEVSLIACQQIDGIP
jgi:hypothetical protein